MKLYLKNFIPYLNVSHRLIHQLGRQSHYIQQHIEPVLKEAAANNDGTLEENDFKKIRTYYALFVVAIVGENYCRLRGKEMSDMERKILTFQGALTGLYDDFFDKELRKTSPVKEMMNAPFTYQPQNSVEKLFIYFLQQVHSNLKNKTQFDKIFEEIYSIQLETKKQINSTIPANELKLISEKKGGLSHLFYRVTLSNPMIEAEYKAIYELGSLLQQVNDIFDVWKDRSSGIATFASVSKDMKQTKSEFEMQLQKVVEQVKQLNYASKNKKIFFLQLMILIGMGIVSLNQYIALQEENNNEFDAALFSRKQLVCDMQKKLNLFKLMRVCLSYDFRF